MQDLNHDWLTRIPKIELHLHLEGAIQIPHTHQRDVAVLDNDMDGWHGLQRIPVQSGR